MANNNSVDLIKCSVLANGINGSHSASIQTDLGQPSVCSKSDELQVYDNGGGFIFQKSKNRRDCNGFDNGLHVGKMSVKEVNGQKCHAKRGINIKVQSFSGDVNGKIEVERDATLCEFKQSIYEEFDDSAPAPSQQRLIWEGQNLDDYSRTLASYGIKNDDTVLVKNNLRGG